MADSGCCPLCGRKFVASDEREDRCYVCSLTIDALVEWWGGAPNPRILPLVKIAAAELAADANLRLLATLEKAQCQGPRLVRTAGSAS